MVSTGYCSLWCAESCAVGGDGWMASPTRCTWVWVNSGSWWWTGRPGVRQSMGSQRVGHDWATELIWTVCSSRWLLLLLSIGSRSEGFRSRGVWVLSSTHNFSSCSEACGIFPDEKSNPCPLHGQVASYPLYSQGSPRYLQLQIFWSCSKGYIYF